MSATLTSHPAMRAWDASWKAGHMPAWFKKAIRARYKRLTNGGSCWDCYEYGALQGELWDHWGSVQRGSVCAVITQPYSNEIDKAIVWARDLRCIVVATGIGAPWAPGTWYFEFLPQDQCSGTARRVR